LAEIEHEHIYFKHKFKNFTYFIRYILYIIVYMADYRKSGKAQKHNF